MPTEPMTCRCKRMEWENSSKMWSDHEQDCLWTTITCPNCNTKCLPTGAISYKDGLFGMLSTPFRKGDLLGLKKQKEETVKIKLSEAVSSIMGDTSGIIGVWIIVWGENPTVLQEVVKAFRKHQALSTCQRHVSSFSSMPVESERSAANIIIHVTGGPTGMTLEITKNRHGKMRRFDCMADCYFKESNMNQNDVEKAWPYKHLRHEISGDASYAGCFRILRDAKKDGVIENWWYTAKGIRGCPTAAVMLKGNTNPVRYDDNDGTKGDLGILREAADYVLGLRKKAEKQPEDVQYLHLRRFKRDGARGLPIGIAWAKGGITLCYIKEGPWYKVGAAFCSYQDDYVEVAGEVLAKERLFNSPMYIHEHDWKGDVARRLTCPQGRQWYEHAVQQGYPEKWQLKEYKETWLKVTASPSTINELWPFEYRI